MRIRTCCGLSVAALATGMVSLQAQNLNGTLNAGFYGSPLAVQTVNTGFGNSSGNDGSGGSELDAAYGAISGGNLYVFLAGTTENNGNHLNLFIAGGAAGQNTLALPGGGAMSAMNGSVFSPGFNATFALDMNDYAGNFYTEEYNLTGTPSGGYVGALGHGATGIYAGSDGGVSSAYINNNHVSTMGASPGALTGATSGAATTTGFELVIPLADIGYTGGSVEVLADINGGGDGYLSNQFLPGLPVGTGNLATAGFNFGATPGEYITIAVPEPSTMVLGATGMATLLLLRRRR